MNLSDGQHPFTLQLEGGEVLDCKRVLRRLPGRRLVCAGRWQGRPVVAKIYRGGRARRDCRHERDAARALEDAGLAPAALLAERRVQPQGWPVLLFEQLQAVPFDQAWRTGSAIRRQVWFESLMVLLARQHQAGLEPRDPHLDNFLVDRRGRVRPIDAGGYRLHAGALSRKASVNNLGLLLAQFPPEALHTQRVALSRYAQLRGWADERLQPELARASDRWRAWRARKLGEKALRNCSEFEVRVWDGLRIHQRRELDADRVNGWIAGGGLVPGAGDSVLKAGRSQTVWRTRLGDQVVVVKRYNVRGPGQRLRRALGGSRARRAWVGAHWLRALGIDSPRPLLMIEERRPGGRAWLVTEPARGEPAHLALAQEASPARLDALAGMLRALARAGLVHGDLKASNLMLAGDRVQLIDLDGLHWPRWNWRRQRGAARDRRRLLRNWRGEPLEAALRARLEEG